MWAGWGRSGGFGVCGPLDGLHQGACGGELSLRDLLAQGLRDTCFVRGGRSVIELMGEGELKAHPPKVGQGLEGVVEGLGEMKQGKVSAVKLVYKI